MIAYPVTMDITNITRYCETTLKKEQLGLALKETADAPRKEHWKILWQVE